MPRAFVPGGSRPRRAGADERLAARRPRAGRGRPGAAAAGSHVEADSAEPERAAEVRRLHGEQARDAHDAGEGPAARDAPVRQLELRRRPSHRQDARLRRRRHARRRLAPPGQDVSGRVRQRDPAARRRVDHRVAGCDEQRLPMDRDAAALEGPRDLGVGGEDLGAAREIARDVAERPPDRVGRRGGRGFQPRKPVPAVEPEERGEPGEESGRARSARRCNFSPRGYPRKGRSTPRSRAASIASGYPASAWRMTPVPGSVVSTRRSRRAAASVPSATTTMPA